MEDSKDGNVWTKHVIKCRLLAPDAGYYTNTVNGGDDRLAYQGQFYLACVVPTGLSTGATLGRLRIRYRCHFFVPQLESTLLSVTLVTPPAGTTFPGASSGSDFLQKIVSLAGVVSGNMNWTPKVDSNGKYFLDLAQGLYRLTRSFNAGAPGTAGSSGTSSQGTPVLSVNEPAAAPAPQPFVQTVSYVTDESNASGNWVAGSMEEDILGVPKGGAKLYMNYANTYSLSNTDWNLVADLVRLSGYTPLPPSGYALAVWKGVDECAQPHLYAEKAVERAKKQRSLACARNLIRQAAKHKESCPTIHSSSVPPIEEAHSCLQLKTPKQELNAETLEKAEVQIQRLVALRKQVQLELDALSP